MIYLFTNGLEVYTSIMLILALLFSLVYEIINGFHDTANSVATVIYTKAMHPRSAVIISVVFNFFGVLLSDLSVAYSITHILSTEFVLNLGSNYNLIMIFSILLVAIFWNLITWYFGIPTSSSHTLIGSIVGVGITNAFVSNRSFIEVINTKKLTEILVSLILSPVIGLVFAGFIVYLIKNFYKIDRKKEKKNCFLVEKNNINKKKLSFWTKTTLIISACGISFFHGANDGQKGIGLIMLMLIGIAPSSFSINLYTKEYDINKTKHSLTDLYRFYQNNQEKIKCFEEKIKNNSSKCVPIRVQQKEKKVSISDVNFSINRVLSILNNVNDYNVLNKKEKINMRILLNFVLNSIESVQKMPCISKKEKKHLHNLRKNIIVNVEYAPIWIIFSVAISLAFGTMISWKRVAKTIGEKIGKSRMTNLQGITSQITTSISIGIASYTGMPVSTTHVLSSAIAGSMLIDGKRLQIKTVRNILTAWILTLPVTIIFSGFLYFLILKIV
ncbi:inorganic phosphate transporter [bacterium endosymbiont of Pedicinus badii]|uniref:inorganic phosphate transporter n=1 Tax=bacterium endosymbiont of Pedicinus badii TaxID=1719126 RepID=UPI0009BB6689|nr:inorganic phosphate transporter [bacterium endosymbiont of Pedicinus badii]OQM34079.1 phosphate transporter PitA [bacterium endosymbiont of Pedicinus badii]